jgi:hypothetical protein
MTVCATADISDRTISFSLVTGFPRENICPLFALIKTGNPRFLSSHSKFIPALALQELVSPSAEPDAYGFRLTSAPVMSQTEPTPQRRLTASGSKLSAS